ncbi:hypothetical protein PENTCL1PPCAC_7630 [Pristionchus entomophagus]|uniref:C2H2-type domain-containing protein n=1 Tax=Pristionchus entomophagus TaxID=358040 RepID=A0AAV5SZD9_9BILA|nr:hypothetical protein PENTCL1PPCAC_7630 [Pristionchus entomophagus]
MRVMHKIHAFKMLQQRVDDQLKLNITDILYSCDNCSFKCQHYQQLQDHLSMVHTTRTGLISVKPPTNNTPECITLDD